MGVIIHIMARYHRAARGLPEQGAQNLHGSAFASAVRSQEPEELPFLNGRGYPSNGLDFPGIDFDQVFYSNNSVMAHSIPRFSN